LSDDIGGALAVALREPEPDRAEEIRRYVRMTETGLLFLKNGKMPIELYGELCGFIGVASDAMRWGVGDALNYGERCYGEDYAQYMDLLHCSYWTLQARRRVAAAIPHAERKPNMWTAFQITAHLEPGVRKPLIEAYEAGMVTTDDLRDEVNALKSGPDCELLPPCPACGGKLSSRRCRDCGLDFSAAVWWLNRLLKEQNEDE